MKTTSQQQQQQQQLYWKKTTKPGTIPMRNLIHGTMPQKLWTTTKNGSTHSQLSEIWTWQYYYQTYWSPYSVNIHQGNEHTNSLKLTFLTPNSGWQFLHSMLYKIICLMLLCTFKAKVTTCKTIKYVFKTLSEVVLSTPTTIHKWFNKPRIQHTKKHRKTSNNSGEFSHNLRASKKSCYNERNYKSGRQGCQHTFMKRKSITKCAATNNSN